VKALTLTQPWASLVACGEKGVETRSWSTRYRGPLAIHAAAGLGPVGGMRGLVDLIESEPFATALRPHLSGYTAEERAGDLPRGVVVAVVELVDVVRIETDGLPAGVDWPAMVRVRPHEHAFGDYRPGRYAWLLAHRFNLHDGVECRGALGLWNVAADVAEEVMSDA
jgi:hypothetical protein